MKRVFEIEFPGDVTDPVGEISDALDLCTVTELDLAAIKGLARLGALESVHDVIRNTDTTATYEAYKQIVYFVQDSIDLVTREIAAAEAEEGKK
jgi:hypothetical protein